MFRAQWLVTVGSSWEVVGDSSLVQYKTRFVQIFHIFFFMEHIFVDPPPKLVPRSRSVLRRGRSGYEITSPFSLTLDRKTVCIFSYSSTREQSNKRSGMRLKLLETHVVLTLITLDQRARKSQFRARKTLTPRFTDFFTDFEKKTDCFAVYTHSLSQLFMITFCFVTMRAALFLFKTISAIKCSRWELICFLSRLQMCVSYLHLPSLPSKY